ncbi:hypothetical protein IU450_28460 [Nocardia abscessus]|uniref:hypothetical protein n=1 Tax=Nocardia abscessus TaxID=120957 RepID=UPI001894D8F5|nr:hypothetical protein [Nocardia abscessus]MBF6339793.1 hypothetical protein [Nocardia abscessus]
MSTRDAVEHAIRAWNQHEIDRGAPAVIDFDFFPPTGEPPGPVDRLGTFGRLNDLLHEIDESSVVQRVKGDLAYLRALMGERPALDEYVRATQGCPAAGWSADYVTAKGDIARGCLDALGVRWGETTAVDLAAIEGPLDASAAPDAIREAAVDYEPVVRRATGTEAAYELTIEEADVDAYWAYWLDGAGQRVRLRLNTRNAIYTKTQARQFALHEVLGHGLQSASIAARCATEDVPWVRLSSVHGPQQVLLEGWAQAMPLFIVPDDEALVARVRIDHYTQLVRAELHLAVNAGTPIEECARHARSRIPWWKDSHIADLLADRSTNPLLRTYMWAYAAGIDWFINLADANATVIRNVLHAAYQAPLTPADLEELWPEGPAVGGPEDRIHRQNSASS